MCNLVNCFTIESSFGIYLDKNMETIYFEESSFLNVGDNIGSAINDYIDLILVKLE